MPPEGISFKDVITNVEKRLIESTLEAAGGVQKRAAELLRIKPTTLNEMIKRYDIGPRRKKDAGRPTDEEPTAPRRVLDALAPGVRPSDAELDADESRAFSRRSERYRFTLLTSRSKRPSTASQR